MFLILIRFFFVTARKYLKVYNKSAHIQFSRTFIPDRCTRQLYRNRKNGFTFMRCLLLLFFPSQTLKWLLRILQFYVPLEVKFGSVVSFDNPSFWRKKPVWMAFFHPLHLYFHTFLLFRACLFPSSFPTFLILLFLFLSYFSSQVCKTRIKARICTGFSGLPACLPARSPLQPRLISVFLCLALRPQQAWGFFFPSL